MSLYTEHVVNYLMIS